MLRIGSLRTRNLVVRDLTVAAGECVAVMGPSGAGKTLMLRAIADLDPAPGEVWAEEVERNAVGACAWRQRVGYVPAESGWWADRVGEHFTRGADPTPLIQALLLPEDALDWQVARLSTGEKQRLALARALTLDPAVLLLDEPTRGLDQKAEAAAESVLKARLRDGLSLLLVTHDRTQAHRLAGRIFWLENGGLSPVRMGASA